MLIYSITILTILSSLQGLIDPLSRSQEHQQKKKKKEETYKIAEKFYLKEVLSIEVKKVIKSWHKKKPAISSCIPVKVLIDSVDTYQYLLIL